MKKKLLFTLIILGIVVYGSVQPAQARLFDTTRTAIEQKRKNSATFKAIKNVMLLQNELCNKRDIENVAKLYKHDFINNDGFDKDVYIKLIQDTWKSYPDIAYATEIRSINLTNNFAIVETYEAAVGTTTENVGDTQIVGELQGFAHSIYHLEKVGQKWLITSENILEEKTALSYGEARFLDINLNAPAQIGAGKIYSTNLTIDAPEETLIVGSIGREKITYPQSRSEEVYRKLSEDNTLERMFTSNTENTNEYNIATIGVTRADFDEKNPQNIRIYMSGMAFVMTRVNVVPENKYIKFEVENEQEDK